MPSCDLSTITSTPYALLAASPEDLATAIIVLAAVLLLGALIMSFGRLRK